MLQLNRKVVKMLKKKPNNIKILEARARKMSRKLFRAYVQ